jgi:uncharacterized protein (TIGR00661 family)
LGKEHIICIAAYLKSSHSLSHIDWTLDALHHKAIPKRRSKELQDLFGHFGVPVINIENASVFLSEAVEFEPDLVISDGEPIAAHVAKSVGAELWYVSALHLLDGIDWSKGQLRYLSRLEKTRKALSRWPEPDRCFVYSPFGDVAFRPVLKPGYEWITPYHFNSQPGNYNYNYVCVINEFERFSSIIRIINSLSEKIALVSPYDETFNNVDNFLNTDNKTYKQLLDGCRKIFTTGETSYIADALYNEKNVCVAPSLNDPEALLNAILIREYSVGSDIAQVELMDIFALNEIETKLARPNETGFLSKQKRLLLHERIT